MEQSTYQQARLARDARFDGQFFVAVKTTGIYCRPICPAPLAEQSLDELKIPHRRSQTLIDFARYMADPYNAQNDPELWRPIKSIGDWTIRYARMRGLSDANVWLGSDLGIQKALQHTEATLDPESASPWQSYLTFQLWNQP